jgi:hypothetical protein
MKMVILDDEDGVLSESSMWSLLVAVHFVVDGPMFLQFKFFGCVVWTPALVEWGWGLPRSKKKLSALIKRNIFSLKRIKRIISM